MAVLVLTLGAMRDIARSVDGYICQRYAILGPCVRSAVEYHWIARLRSRSFGKKPRIFMFQLRAGGHSKVKCVTRLHGAIVRTLI